MIFRPGELDGTIERIELTTSSLYNGHEDAEVIIHMNNPIGARKLQDMVYSSPRRSVKLIPNNLEIFCGRGSGKSLLNSMFNTDDLQIKRVIFGNKKITKIIWNDGTSTTVTVQKPDKFDPRIGILECIYRKLSNNKNKKFNNLHHNLILYSKVFTKEYYPNEVQLLHDILLIESAASYFGTYDFSKDLDILVEMATCYTKNRKKKKDNKPNEE